MCARQQVWRVLRERKVDLDGRKSWCESNDPEFAAKAADVVGLYMSPPESVKFSCVRAFHGRLSSTECSRQTLGKEDGELRVGGSPVDGRLPMNAKIPQRQVEQFGGGFV